MATDDLTEATFKREAVELTLNAQDHRDVVRRSAWCELVKEPETLLREGERRLSGAGRCHKWCVICGFG